MMAHVPKADGNDIFKQHRELKWYEDSMLFLSNINKNLSQRLNERSNQVKLLNEQLISMEEKERKSIASDIHDSIAQNLALAMLKISSIKEDVVPLNIENLSKIQHYIEQSVKDVRSIMNQLTLTFLEKSDISIAIGKLIEELSTHYDGKMTYFNHLKKQPVLDETTEIFLYRATGELVTNIIKHSKSKNAGIRLLSTDKILTLEIEDDGVGFQMQEMKHKMHGYGVSTMKKRIQNLDGNMEILSKPGQGSVIRLFVPIHSLD